MVLLEWFTLNLGGWPHIFGVATASFAHRPAGEGSIVLPPGTHLSYVSLALGSALSNFLYPHVLTGTLAARNRTTVRTGLSTLPIYTLLLGFFGLLGFAAIAAGTRPAGGDFTTILPQLLQSSLNGWSAGLIFAALGISALVPASIMSIGVANLFTRGIYREFIRQEEAATAAKGSAARPLAVYREYQRWLGAGDFAHLGEAVDLAGYTENCLGLTGWTTGFEAD